MCKICRCPFSEFCVNNMTDFAEDMQLNLCSIFFFPFGRRIPYTVALKHKHGACAALLNPTSAEPMVWPSPLKFISELNQEAKVLLEQALMEANREREKSILKGTAYSVSSPSHSDTGIDDNISEVNYCPL